MKILFLTLAKINSIDDNSIYQDLLRKFNEEGHSIFIVTPIERRFAESTRLYQNNGVSILKVWTPNIQKTNIIEKGIGTIILELLFKKAINRHFNNEKFDLIIYSTPPITFTSLVHTLKKKNDAKTYLLLKDIFPQNAVDLKMFSDKGILYKYFRRKEIQLYKMSDWIGCMSKENKKYILKHNLYLKEDKVEINPNSIYLKDVVKSTNINHEFLNLIPISKTIFIYGGNLGKPQGIEFLLDIIIETRNNEKAFFVVVGSGTEKRRIMQWFEKNQPANAIFINELNQTEYDVLLQKCHVGLVFLNPNFTIPNYPSRILSYMKNRLPILFATDKNTDVGREAEEYNYGLWCESGNLEKFISNVESLTVNDELRIKMGLNGFERLKKDFNVDYSYSIIMNHFKKSNF